MASAMTIATDTRGPSFCAALQRDGLKPFLHALADRELVAGSRRGGCAARRRRHGRRARAGRGASPATSSSAARAASVSPSRPAVTMRASTRSRAACAPAGLRSGRRRSGNCGSATSKRGFRDAEPLRLLAELGERGGAHALEIAAIGRKRQVALEDFAAWTAAARSGSRERSGGFSWPKLRLSRGSIRRASCIDSVEPPETMRPLPANCVAARASASSRRRHGRKKRLSS